MKRRALRNERLLKKELEEYEKSKKSRSLEYDKRFYNFCEDDEDDMDGYEDDDDVGDYKDDDIDDEYVKNNAEDKDEDSSMGSLILNIGDVIVTLIVCIILIFSVVRWLNDGSNIDSSSMLEVNLDNSSAIDSTTSSYNEVESGSGEVDVSSGAVVDRISYKGLEPGKKYYIHVNVYNKIQVRN